MSHLTVHPAASPAAAAPAAAPLPYVPPLALGRIVATPGALDALAEARVNGAGLLARHARGDWGDVGPHDAAANRRAALAGDERMLSAYVLPSGARLWIITEADRSCTTFLLPDEY